MQRRRLLQSCENSSQVLNPVQMVYSCVQAGKGNLDVPSYMNSSKSCVAIIKEYKSSFDPMGRLDTCTCRVCCQRSAELVVRGPMHMS
jgi:hypothetical protein